MTELLDHEHSETPPSRVARMVNLSLFGVILLTVLYTIWTVQTFLSKMNPLLPNYAPYFYHQGLINYTVFQFFGLIPALFPTIRGKHRFSIATLICFMLLAFLFKDSSHFYRWFIPM